MVNLRNGKVVGATQSAYRAKANSEISDANAYLIQDVAQQNILDLEGMKESLETLRDSLKQSDEEILNSIDDDDELAEEAIECTKFEVDIAKTVAKLRKQINRLEQQENRGQDHDGSSRTSVVFQQRYANIPKLDVQKFDGDYMKFQAFWDSFEAAVGNNAELSKVQKLQYLMSYLTKDAKKLVEGYRLLEENYDNVVSVLKERYGDEEIAICMHFEKLFAMPSGDQTKAKLQEIYGECEMHIRSLIALGLEEDTFGKVFVPLILSKLPRNIRIQLHRNNEGKPWVLKELRNKLKDEIKYREMSETYVTDTSRKNDDHRADANQRRNVDRRWQNERGDRSYRPPGTGTGLAAHRNVAGSCVYCGDRHYPEQCKKVVNVKDRKDIIRQQRRCFRCLGDDHSVRECKVDKPCYHCERTDHHRSLCFNQNRYTSSPAHSERLDEEVEQEETEDSTKNDEAEEKLHTASVASGKMSKSETRVQMELAQITFENGIRANIFFDKGSTVSYVSEKLFKQQKLKVREREVLSIGSFSSDKRKTTEYKKTMVLLPVVQGEKIPLHAYVTPHITAPVQQHGMELKDVSKLKSMQLSLPLSSKSQNVEIDILIGLDQYRRFVPDKAAVKLSNGIEAHESKFGFILSGPFRCDHAMTTTAESESLVVTLLRTTQQHELVDTDIERFWSLEDVGIKDNPYLDDDENALNQFNSTVRKVNGRYEVRWPYKEKNPNLPTNLGLAVGRLKSLLQRFKDQPDLLPEYEKILTDQESLGIIEEVTDMSSKHRVHYVPHHFVVDRSRATTKMRMVFDASARSGKGKLSVNECLLRGPIILEDLVGMLLRFRLGKVAMC